MELEINQINSDWLDSNRNVENEQSLISWYGDFTKTLSGTSRTLELAGKVARLGNEIQPSETLHRIKEGSSTALTSFGLVRIPLTTQKAFQSLWAIGENDGIELTRKVSTAAKSVMHMLAAWASAIFLLTSLAPLRIVTNTAFLTAEVTDLTESLSDYSKARGLANATNGSLKEAFDHSKNYYFYRAVKNTAAIASGVLGLLALAFGMHLVPVIGSAILSLGVTLLTINRDYYKSIGNYSVISFDRPVCI